MQVLPQLGMIMKQDNNGTGTKRRRDGIGKKPGVIIIIIIIVIIIFIIIIIIVIIIIIFIIIISINTLAVYTPKSRDKLAFYAPLWLFPSSHLMGILRFFPFN